MKVEISNGELLDKISIIELKLLRVQDQEKLVNIQNEFNELNPLCQELFEKYDGQLQNHYLELAKINSLLWDIEEWIREAEAKKDFGPEFIQLARSVYTTNDRRSDVKKIINFITSSKLVEEKSYKNIN